MGPAPVFGYHVIIFNCRSSAPDDFIVVSLLPDLAAKTQSSGVLVGVPKNK